MIVLADNDIILKLAQCDLLDVLPDVVGQKRSEVFILPTAKYWLQLNKPAKALNKCGNEETLERLNRFLETTKVLPEIKNTALLVQLEKIDGIDDGEMLLLAAAVETENPLLITGDKVCLRTLIEHQETLPTIFSALQGAVITFESVILLAMRLLGFAIVKQKLLGSPKPDQMLRIVLKGETREADFIEGLCSYSKEVIPLLAFKEHLPIQLNQ